MTNFIKIDLIGSTKSGKTNIYKVLSTTGTELGLIKWFSNWRKYVFYPEPGTIFDARCLSEITNHLNELNNR